MMDNKKYIERFIELGEKYNFPVVSVNGKEVLMAKNTDDKYVDWIFYNSETGTVSFSGNTDNCNIWLYNTRKDFTPEKTIQFITDLNNVFELDKDERLQIQELIDPEDWQEIANIRDAYKDKRYNTKM